MNGLNQLVIINNSKLKSPLTLLREKSQNLDNLDLRIQQQHALIISNKKNQIEKLSASISHNNPISKLNLISYNYWQHTVGNGKSVTFTRL